MKKPYLTAWFSSKKKPTIPGVYETNASNVFSVFQNWNGKEWGCYASTAWRAHEEADNKSMFQDVKWRGLAEDPSKDQA